ncbi:carbohydrate porin [Acetobacter senegalensis]|uniref:carbohydrate porin n=1 Tax=Acetobacter senegalensis TaxID=446692 RepID=UPI0020A0D87C|nr:carbohydrate porin [Acetobacter senegalensis]MCP1196044.1 carbohydrate porin [Acetobacter senegalensis]
MSIWIPWRLLFCATFLFCTTGVISQVKAAAASFDNQQTSPVTSSSTLHKKKTTRYRSPAVSRSAVEVPATGSSAASAPFQLAASSSDVKPVSFWNEMHVMTEDNASSSSHQRERVGVNASALGSAWPEVRVVPELDRLLGSLGGWRQRLSKHGFDFTLTYMTEGIANVAGGRRQGFDYSHQVVMGTDFDLEKMFGLNGLSFHMLGIQRAGRSVATDYLGKTGLIQPQQDYGAGGNVLYKLVYMYFEKTLLNKKLVLDFGRMPANIKFGTSYFGCYALNSITCAHPTAISVASKWRSWPFSQWGIMARFNPGNHLYAQGGVFEASATEGGRAGFNFSFAPLGYVIPVELGWEPSLGHNKLTGHYKIGGYFDTSDHPDPFTALDGSPVLISHKLARIEHQRGAWYVGADQMVWRFGPAKDQGLLLFGLAGWNQGASLAGQTQYTVGIISQGMFPSRITDAVSLFWSWQSVNRKITRLQELQYDLGYPLKNGVTLPQSNFQVLELTYTAFLTRGLKFLPDLQYIVHPDANRTYPNALEAGFRLLAQF